MDVSIQRHLSLFAHPEPVSLNTLQLVGKGEAVHLQQVEEGVSHHVGDAVVRLAQTVTKLVITVAVRHGENVAVEDAKLGVKGQDGVFALVVFPAAAVCVRENS